MPLKSHQDFDSFYDLLLDVIENDPEVSQKGLAAALGQSVNSVSRKLRREGLVFRIDELPVILSYCHNIERHGADEDQAANYLRVMDYLADLVDCLVVRRPGQEGASPTDLEMSDLLDRFGGLAGRYVLARSPIGPGGRGLTRQEKNELLTLACEIQKRTAGLIMAINDEEVVDEITADAPLLQSG